MPLWEMDHREAVDEFIHLGFVTMIVTVNLSLGMTEDDLGRVLTPDYIKELEARNIDLVGKVENSTQRLLMVLFSNIQLLFENVRLLEMEDMHFYLWNLQKK